MENLLELFECVAESPRHGEYLTEFLNTCAEHQTFSSKNSNAIQPFIAFTNVKLGSSKDRLEGLLLLKAFLPQCSDEKFTTWAISWMQQCVKGTDKTNSVQTNGVAYEVLGTLFEMSGYFQEMTKNVNNSVVSRLMEQLGGIPTQLNASILRCLTPLLRHYGATCTSHRHVIESFVLGLVDSRDAVQVSLGARVFSLLPLVGGGGALGSNHKTSWLLQQRQTCSSLSGLLDALLENVNTTETFVRESGVDGLPLAELTDVDPVVKVQRAANRLGNLAQYLSAMLLGAFPVAKSVLPNLIVGIVCRGLSADCATLGKELTTDLLTLGSVLPQIHVALLRTLRALIACLGRNLYPWGKVICRLLLHTLTWTSAERHEYGVTRPYAALRSEACQTLQAWFRAAGAGASAEVIADELFAALKRDVRTEKAVVQLTVQGGKKTKKLRKQLAAEESLASASTAVNKSGSGRVKLVNALANQGPCLAALDTLYWLVHCSGVSLRPTLHKALQETVLAVLYDVQRSNASDPPVPYSAVPCRLSVYRLLSALTLEPHPSWPAPIQHALHLLAVGRTDLDARVAGECAVALCAVAKVTRPCAQPLAFPVSLEEMRLAVGLDLEKEEEMNLPRAPPSTPTAFQANVEDVTKAKPAKRSVSFGLPGEVTTPRKKLRHDAPISIYLTSDEEGEVEPPGVQSALSNVSVASSNSNYQDLVLNKSNVSRADYFEDCLDRTMEVSRSDADHGREPLATSSVRSVLDEAKRPVEEVDLVRELENTDQAQELDRRGQLAVQEVDLVRELENTDQALELDSGGQLAVQEVDLVRELENTDQALELDSGAEKAVQEVQEPKGRAQTVQEVDLEEIEQVDLAEDEDDDDSCEIMAENGRATHEESFRGLVDDQIVELCISDFISNLPKN